MVYAKQDMHDVWGVKSRWIPRVVKCALARDSEGSDRHDYVVKYRRETPEHPKFRAESAAMCISELVGTLLIRAAGLRVFEPALVYASAGIGAHVLEGYHYGTVYLPTTERDLPEPRDREARNPLEAVRLWVLDTWLGNIDRGVYGNTVFLPHGQRWDILAADQSDCFGGAGYLAGGASLKRADSAFDVGSYFNIPVLLSDDPGLTALRNAAIRVAELSHLAPIVSSRVPEQWWAEASVDPSDLVAFLTTRATNISTLCGVTEWEEARAQLTGAPMLNFDDA